jgi:hypothetical protein
VQAIFYTKVLDRANSGKSILFIEKFSLLNMSKIWDINKLFKCGACATLAGTVITTGCNTYKEIEKEKVRAQTLQAGIRTNPNSPDCRQGSIKITPEELSKTCFSSPNTPQKKEDVIANSRELTTTNSIENIAIFKMGEFGITNDSQLRTVNNVFAGVNKMIEQRSNGRNAVVLLEGSADPIGNSTLNRTFVEPLCGPRNFKDIEVHYPINASNNVYEKQLAFYPVTNVTNSSLPNLRSRTLQCWLSAKYPNLRVEILHGGVQPIEGEEFRAVKIKLAFEDRNNITANGGSNLPSAD